MGHTTADVYISKLWFRFRYISSRDAPYRAPAVLQEVARLLCPGVAADADFCSCAEDGRGEVEPCPGPLAGCGESRVCVRLNWRLCNAFPLHMRPGR